MTVMAALMFNHRRRNDQAPNHVSLGPGGIDDCHDGHGHGRSRHPRSVDPPLTRDQLRDSTPEELVDVIMHLQAHLSEQSALFSARYDSLSHEMLNMKRSLSHIFAAQCKAMSTAATVGRILFLSTSNAIAAC